MTFINQMPDSVCLMGNPQLLYSIFGNLLDNAINYAGTDTTLTLTAQRQGPMWHFFFSDDGVGVAAEHLSRIFERFYRVDSSRTKGTGAGGTGLGLSIAKWIAEQHDIIISMDSELGKGTRIHLLVPLAEKKQDIDA